MASSFEKASTEELIKLNNNWLSQFGESDKSITTELEKRGITITGVEDRKATYDYAGSRTQKAGEPYADVFKDAFTRKSVETENATNFMRKMSRAKREEGISEEEFMHGVEVDFIRNPDKYEEMGITSEEQLRNAINKGWDSAKVLDTSGILRTHQAGVFPNWEDIKNLGTKAGEGIIRALQYLDPFSSAYGSENKESFILPEKKYRTSNVYDEIGQHSERRIQEEPFSKNYDKATYLGTNNIDSYLNIDEVDYDGINNFDPYLNIDTLHWDETDRKNAIHNNAFNLMKQNYEGPSWLERHNTAQREYNRVAPGANVTSWGEGHGNPSAAVQGRRNEKWMNSMIGSYTMGKLKSDPTDLINKYGTAQQKQQIADAIARKTHNPYANYKYWEGQGVDKADITADVTGMYTDSGSSGMDDIGDVTAPTDSWSDTGGTGVSGFSDDDGWGSYIARGGMVKDAPRYRYAEGGIVNLLPKGAW